MIKNILKSKLFVLCSMLFCSLVVSVFFFGISSKAAYEESNVTDWYVNKGFNLSSYPTFDEDINSFYTYYSNNQNYKCLQFWINPSFLVLVCGDSLTYSQGSSSLTLYVNASSGQYWQINPSGTSPQHFVVPFTGEISFNPVGYGVGNKVLYNSYSEIGLQTIDWNNPYYSSNIVAPSMRVTYRELSSTPVIDVPLNIQVSSYPSSENEYYVQLFGLVNYDRNYFVQNTRDGMVYNGMDLERYTSYIDIVTPEELLKPSDLSFDMLHLRFSDGWYNVFPPDDIFSFTFQEGIPNPLQTAAISKFNNFRKNATFADNTVYVYARYFIIDNDNNFVVGPWRIWKSYNPNEFTTEVPNYYLPYGVVPGTTGTNTSVTPVSTSSPEPSVIDSPVQTNPTVNVTVTQNVPNYPDYPTIASYNKDNLLVDTMDQLNSLEGFFGDFGSFLVTAFAFMPAWIWAIIGVGFSLSIVVMFLKIL